MGSCNSKSIHPTKTSQTEPFIYYLNRDEHEVLYLTQTSTKKMRLPPEIKLYSDSGIGYLDQHTVMTVGGTNLKGNLKKHSYIINLSEMTYKKVSNLPLACKLGALNPYQNFVYYSGGLTENTGESTTDSPYIGVPLMRYNLSSNTWELFIHRLSSVSIPSLENEAEIYQNLQSDTQRDHPNIIKVKDLIYPGTFLLGSRIYYFGGTLLRPDIAPNFKVYSVDLNSEKLNFSPDNIEFMKILNNPVCASNSKFAFICGGYNENMQPNMDCYVFSIRKGFVKILGKDLEGNENYPPKCTEDYIIMMAFPKFALKFKKSQGWILYNLSKNATLRSATPTIARQESSVSFESNKTLFRRGTIAPQMMKSPTVSGTIKAFRTKKFATVVNKSRTSGVEVMMSSIIKKSEEPNPNIKLLNSPNESIELGNQINFDNKIRIAEDLEYAMIISPNNDYSVKLSRKQAIKLIKLVAQNLNSIELNALQLNIIAQKFSKRPEISIQDLSETLNSVLTRSHYRFTELKDFIRIMFKILERPRLGSSRIKEIFELLDITSLTKSLPKDSAILLLTRIAKALNYTF